MQMKYILIIVLALIIAMVAFIFIWFDGSEDIVVSAPVFRTETVQDVADEDEISQDKYYVEIKVEYKKLEKARRNLGRRLARIKGVMWNMELPAKETEEIVRKMRKAYMLLKTKKLLGAFSGLESISNEVARIEYAYQGLEGMVERIKIAKSAS